MIASSAAYAGLFSSHAFAIALQTCTFKQDIMAYLSVHVVSVTSAVMFGSCQPVGVISALHSAVQTCVAEHGVRTIAQRFRANAIAGHQFKAHDQIKSDLLDGTLPCRN